MGPLESDEPVMGKGQGDGSRGLDLMHSNGELYLTAPLLFWPSPFHPFSGELYFFSGEIS